MTQLLIDSTIILEHLKNNAGLFSRVKGHYKLFISSTTMTELLASKKANDPASNREIRDFISENFEVLPVNSEMAVLAGTILREQQTTLAVAQIAATAITKDLALLTYDVNTFDQIPDLKIVDV